MKLRVAALVFAWLAASALRAATASGDFPLVQAGAAAAIVFSAEDARVVDLAVHDLAADIERVSGVRPSVHADARDVHGAVVLVGTLDHCPTLDALVGAGRLGDAAQKLRGAWESFLIATVSDPMPGVPVALVILGSDRRGTAFGAYEVSQMIGVSPWHWWADVTPEKKSELLIAGGTRRFGPPSVKFRGVFLNDEDWGLQPWAAQNFEPEHGGIGPKTYARLFELMLRLKANTVWPAMHACTKPFNAFPENKRIADDYAIVMGSSHAEPMLRNNVGEWPHDRPKDYNYVANRAEVRAYWEERVRENGRFENIYTLGMRGVHDSGIQGARTDAERIRVLEQVFADQREMLTRHVGPDLARIPQMFCAYKEVLGLYRQGLKVPEDVTIVWPDDNFGYVRNFASEEERRRAGGFGVYYHLSYLGAPLAYLWLYTTPPALVWEEMTKAYAHGARSIWIANVGDLKPAEIGTEFFLQLAWDVQAWRHDNIADFLRGWATREFGAESGPPVAEIMRRFYVLNFARKPEHLQWWLPREAPRPSDFTDEEIEGRLAAFAQLAAEAEALATGISPAKRDAFFELVGYPVRGAALANARYFLGERGQAEAARAADAELRALTRRYNEEIAGGKWRGLMRLEPADGDWKSMRIAPWAPPENPRAPLHAPAGQIALAAADAGGAAAHVVGGLGRSGRAVALGPEVELVFTFEAPAGPLALSCELLPTHPLHGDALRLSVALGDLPAQPLALPVRDGGSEWAQGVLAGFRPATTRLEIAHGGRQTLRVRGIDAGVVLDRLVLTPTP